MQSQIEANTVMSHFADRLFEAIQADVFLYEVFVQICREDLPPDADERYEWLRNNGYVVRDEADINVYVTKVASRHFPKFQWLYDNLFKKNSGIFQGELDLVIWGCGCGLDLLALYDRAMKQNNPQLWLVVRSVTLIDISEVALTRAKEIAEVLFPAARGRIGTRKIDLKCATSFKVEIPCSVLFTPRLHLVSNVIDLFDGETAVLDFAKKVMVGVARRYTNEKEQGRDYYNDIWIAFSPEYGGWGRVAQNMSIFKSKWEKYRLAVNIDQEGEGPDKCAYVAFAAETLAKQSYYLASKQGNRLMRGFVKGLNRAFDKEVEDDGRYMWLIREVTRINSLGKEFLDVYEWVDVQTFIPAKGNATIDRILFVPKRDSQMAPIVVCFGNQRFNAPDQKKKTWEAVLKNSGAVDYDLDELVSCTRELHWNTTKRMFSDDLNNFSFTLDKVYDFSAAFIIDPKGAKPLPALDTGMDRRQRNIILGRQQLRRIRGGAGCGKTTTMLWHGVMSILRTHQPVLVACKTVTLFSHNQRRMAATILAQVPGLNYVERNLIQFKTIDKYLCEYNIDMNSCEISFCGWCRRRFNRELERNNKLDLDRIVPVACRTGLAKLPECVLLEKYTRNQHTLVPDLVASEKDLLCKSCKKKLVDALCRKDGAVLSKAESFGAVMVDEIQSVEPNLVQALYNLTEEGNPHREFYAFCDERQCLETEAVEIDNRVKKLRVKTPKGGDGRQFRGDWFGLSKPYRQLGELSGVLSEVTKTFQKFTDVKYGNDETEYPPYNGLTGAFSVLMTQNCPNSLCGEVLKAVNHLKGIGEKRITIVCDSVLTVYSLLKNANVQNWLSTHKPGATFLEEQKLRNDFEETEDHIGLTTIQLVQGWDLECVILIVTQDKGANEHTVESVLTGITRAKQQLRLIDASPTHWVYDLLKRYN